MRSQFQRKSVGQFLSALGIVAALVTFLIAQQPGSTPLIEQAVVAAGEGASSATREKLAEMFSGTVKGFLESNCFDCHDDQLQSGELNLTKFASLDDISHSFGKWEKIRNKIEAGEMPPEDAGRIPSQAERQPVIEWIRDFRRFEAARNAGDPGRVLARRLSNAEYNYTIRDLVGFDLQPAKEFPVDPANEAGFDNSGESLSMSPALLTKYLAAARTVAEHLVLKPHGFDFAPHPAVMETDRDKYAVNRIIAFYKRQNTDVADYFFALWWFQNRAALGHADATLAEVAARESVASGYLAMIRELLQDRKDAFGPLAKLHERWDALPVATASNDPIAAARAATKELRDFVVTARQKLAWEFEIPTAPRNTLHIASQTVVMHANRQAAAHRRKLNPNVLVPADQVDSVKAELAADSRGRGRGRGRGDARARQLDPDLIVPADDAERAKAIAALEKFSNVFPDAFLVSERTSTWLARGQTGRLLSAGFHSSTGYFRDDLPLYELILDDKGRRELDTLWQELDFISSAPARQLSAFIWFERTDSRFLLSEEFNHIRAEDQDVANEENFNELRRLYQAKGVASGLNSDFQEIVARFFDELGSAIRWVKQARLDAEPHHLESLLEFAERAYRRPLTGAERDELLSFYRELRTETGLSHEDAIRDAVASVLMSPHFLFRIDLVPEGEGIHPLDDFALANRLSYFLWSSMPDKRLVDLAAAGELKKPEVLAREAQRMLKDERVRGLAVEFAGNWLDIRRFEEHNAVDRERFPSFDNGLRQAMFEEPIRMFVDVVQKNRSILDFLYADDTIVNGPLARHYGIPGAETMSEAWVRAENTGAVERGGLLPMAVFLTKNAPGLRTSPVKRGYWVVRRILGEEIPPPPPNVPDLPEDESKLGELTLPEVLARHRQDPACAGCHERFDSFGLAFEGFGPIGERRSVDLGGRPVETSASFPGGDEGSGLAGLRQYIRDHRQQDFLDNFTRKLLSYALGRSLAISDDALLGQMSNDLATSDHRFQVLIERIVTSKQFMNGRGGLKIAKDAPASRE